MKKKTFAFLVAILTFMVGVAVAKFSLPKLFSTPPLPNAVPELQLSNYRLSGPYQHENLTVFLVHGPNSNSQMFTPLQEAMERGVVIVHETSSVNELAIENVSASEEVFVQAGDIVKGGRQDRVLAVDLIVPAKSGQMPIDAFCVENGRWTRRAAEPAVVFSRSDEMIATKELKMAARQDVSQHRVWAGVAAAQTKLSDSVNRDVRSDLSRTSMQLAQENESVQQTAAAYVNKLSSIIEGSSDAIGFAFAINGNLNSAEVYSSNALFKRFWPRLLKTAAIEAVAERTASEQNQCVSLETTGEFLVASEKGSETLNEITARTHMLKREAEKSVFFETRDMNHGAAWIHRSYLTR